MRTTIIPAQITTVEDKIAGSLNMAQILILMVPVLWTGLVYILFIPAMKLAPYKLALVGPVTVISIILAIRIKDKIIAEWLGIVLKYHFRPKIWIFNKNSTYCRAVDIPDIPDIPDIAILPKTAVKKQKAKPTEVNVADLIKLENLIGTGKVAVRYQFNNKHV